MNQISTPSGISASKRIGPAIQQPEDPADVSYPSADAIFSRRIELPLRNAGATEMECNHVHSVFMVGLVRTGSPEAALHGVAPLMDALWDLGRAGWSRSIFTGEMIADFLGGRPANSIIGVAEHVNRVGGAWSDNTRRAVVSHVVSEYKRVRAESEDVHAAAQHACALLTSFKEAFDRALVAAGGTHALAPFEPWLFGAWRASTEGDARDQNGKLAGVRPLDECIRRLKVQTQNAAHRAAPQPRARR